MRNSDEHVPNFSWNFIRNSYELHTNYPYDYCEFPLHYTRICASSYVIHMKFIGRVILQCEMQFHMNDTIVHHRNASPDHHSRTTKPVVLDAVACLIMFLCAFPDPYVSVGFTYVEPTFICQKHRAPMANLPMLVFFGKRPPSCTMKGCEDQANKWTSRP